MSTKGISIDKMPIGSRVYVVASIPHQYIGNVLSCIYYVKGKHKRWRIFTDKGIFEVSTYNKEPPVLPIRSGMIQFKVTWIYPNNKVSFGSNNPRILEVLNDERWIAKIKPIKKLTKAKVKLFTDSHPCMNTKEYEMQFENVNSCIGYFEDVYGNTIHYEYDPHNFQLPYKLKDAVPSTFVVPDGVIKVGCGCFDHMKNLNDVYLPDSCMEIARIVNLPITIHTNNGELKFPHTLAQHDIRWDAPDRVKNLYTNDMINFVRHSSYWKIIGMPDKDKLHYVEYLVNRHGTRGAINEIKRLWTCNITSSKSWI